MLQCHDKFCPATTEVFLWNNALNIAIGQCIIAGAVGVWCLILVEPGDESVTGTAVERFDGFFGSRFFTPNAEKGKNSPIKTSVWNVFRFLDAAAES